TIVDTLHPAPMPPTSGSRLMLVATNDTATSNTPSLPCPLRPERLLQRLFMLANTQRLALGQGWSLDMLARTLEHEQSAPLSLTEKECVLLKHLLQAHPTPLGRDDLLEQVWGMASAIDTHTLETHIYRLRSKLETLTPRPCDIRTHDGAYVLAFEQKTS
ncbi:MAG: helix-turn-helix domain-containing protein, partial [Rickettsiales bacterium]|nr:helix-turn-helix domain-containing protein [Rickettsiales bacterium]